MKSLEAIKAQFEVELAHSGLPDAEKNAARIRIAERLEQERQDRVKAIVSGEMAAQSANPLRALAGTVVAGGAKFADAATLGYLPSIVGALGGDKEKTSIALEAMGKTNPIASAAGTVGGYVSNATPAGALGAAASRAGSGAVRGIGSKAFADIAMRPFMQRASLRFLENMGGGMASVGATELLGAGDRGESRSLSQRLHDTASAAPATAALSAVTAGVSAKWMRPVSAELGPVFDKFKRITGREISPDIASDSAELQATFANIQRIPGMADEVKAAQNRLIGGLREMVADMGAAAGAKGDEAKAAGAVRRLVGDGRPGSVTPATAARRAPEMAALNAYSGSRMDQAAHSQFLADIRSALQDKDALDPRGSAMTTLLRDFAKHSKDPLDLNRLEAFRKRIGNLAFAMLPQDPRYADRGRVEASRLYAIVDKAIERSFPDYSKALRAGEKLRRMEEALADVKVSDVDAKTVARFWSGDSPLQRFEALKRFATPEDVGAVKGFLFDGLVRYATLADGSMSLAKLQRALNGQTMFNRKTVDAALPGVADELLKIGKVYDRARKGILRPEGSPTAGALLRTANYAINALGSTGIIASLFTNPYLVIGPALGGAGLRWVMRQHLSRMVNGARADAMSRLSQGQLPPAIGRSAVALDQLGGLSGTARLGAQSVGAAGQAAGQVLKLAAGAAGRNEQ